MRRRPIYPVCLSQQTWRNKYALLRARLAQPPYPVQATDRAQPQSASLGGIGIVQSHTQVQGTESYVLGGSRPPNNWGLFSFIVCGCVGF